MSELSTVILSSHDNTRARIPYLPAEFKDLAKKNKIGKGKEHPTEEIRDYIFLETVCVGSTHTYLNGGHLKALRVDNTTGTCAIIDHKHKAGTLYLTEVSTTTSKQLTTATSSSPSTARWSSTRKASPRPRWKTSSKW